MSGRNFDQKYWDQAMVGLRNYTPDGSPLRVYRIADGEIHTLLSNMRSTTSSPVALEARGDDHYFEVYEHNEHLASVRRSGNALHVDSSPARKSYDHAEAIFYQRFWSALSMYTSACDA